MSHSKKKVLCFGLVMIDILVTGVKKLPTHWEESVPGVDSIVGIGGGAANSARTFGKLGVGVDLLSRVGDDDFGEMVKTECQKDGVNISTLITDENAPTGVAIGLVHQNADRCFITVQGANREIVSSDFSSIDINDYDFLHINGFFQYPKVEKSLKDVLIKFKEKGIPISLDLASTDPFNRWYAAVSPFINQIDYFFLNSTQLQLLTEEKEIRFGVEKLVNDGVKNVIIKLGSDGCAIYDSNLNCQTVPSAPLSCPVVDTTGAGDSFDAAYIVGLLNDWQPEKCARFANTVAGNNCCKFGATAGVPSFQQALEYMENQSIV